MPPPLLQLPRVQVTAAHSDLEIDQLLAVLTDLAAAGLLRGQSH